MYTTRAHLRKGAPCSHCYDDDDDDDYVVGLKNVIVWNSEFSSDVTGGTLLVTLAIH